MSTRLALISALSLASFLPLGAATGQTSYINTEPAVYHPGSDSAETTQVVYRRYYRTHARRRHTRRNTILRVGGGAAGGAAIGALVGGGPGAAVGAIAGGGAGAIYDAHERHHGH
jgi:outer membrane lipoprotein SlyB